MGFWWYLTKAYTNVLYKYVWNIASIILQIDLYHQFYLYKYGSTGGKTWM